MIKFFKNIRRRLLRENRFTRYLIYAIGEIILVVIGILIALQINNWNEDRKLHNAQRVYLEQLYEDIVFMQEGYEKRIVVAKERVRVALKGLRFLEKCNLSNSDKANFDQLLLSHQSLSGYYSVHETYDEMLSANVLASLGNQELKNSIEDLYTSLDFSNSFIPYFRSDLGRASDIIWRYISFGYDSQEKLTVNYDLNEICNKRELKNALVEVVDSRLDYLDSFEDLLLKIVRTRKDIATELSVESD